MNDISIDPRDMNNNLKENNASFDPDVTIAGQRARKERGELQVGDVVLNRYELLEKLGSGAMGVVFKCRDQVSRVEYALKMVPPELARDATALEDVRENFQLIHGLKHPNIASADFLDRDENGTYFLIMEYASGESLAQWMKRKWKSGRPELSEVINIVKQIAAALDYAHSQQILHRDVKPANVMVDDDGRVKVLDFGLASKVRNTMTMLSIKQTNTSGTPHYLSPEQFKGKYPRPASDQYALGVLAYQMLSGRLPFDSDDYNVLRSAVLNEEVDPIEEISDGLNECLSIALSKDPGERFSSCTEFADNLAEQQDEDEICSIDEHPEEPSYDSKDIEKNNEIQEHSQEYFVELKKPNHLILFATRTCPNCALARKFLDQAGFSYDVIFANEDIKASDKYSINSVPSLVVIREDGSIDKFINCAGIRYFIEKEKKAFMGVESKTGTPIHCPPFGFQKEQERALIETGPSSRESGLSDLRSSKQLTDRDILHIALYYNMRNFCIWYFCFLFFLACIIILPIDSLPAKTVLIVFAISGAVEVISLYVCAFFAVLMERSLKEKFMANFIIISIVVSLLGVFLAFFALYRSAHNILAFGICLALFPLISWMEPDLHKAAKDYLQNASVRVTLFGVPWSKIIELIRSRKKTNGGAKPC